MTVVDAVAAVMFAAIIVYSIFGGADFGSGVWDLLAGRGRRGAELRKLIDHAIGPVWEANHVWLIFVLVFLWTAFPRPFGALMRELAVPFWLAGLGIVLRATGFALRKYAPSFTAARVAGATFALSSLVTPFFLGSIAGAVASGRVDPTKTTIGVSPLTLTSVIGGVLAVLTCTFLAGLFLTAEAAHLGQRDLSETLRRRSLIVGIVTGAAAMIAIVPLTADAPTLASGLTGRAAPLMLMSAAAGTMTLWSLHRNRVRHARTAGVIAVASVVAGWGAAQYPWLLVDHTTLADGAGNRAALIGLLVASGAAAVLVLPPLVYLFRLADTNQVGESL